MKRALTPLASDCIIEEECSQRIFANDGHDDVRDPLIFLIKAKVRKSMLYAG